MELRQHIDSLADGTISPLSIFSDVILKISSWINVNSDMLKFFFYLFYAILL